MKPQATAIKVKTQDVAIKKHKSSFAKVVDGRKNPIRGLWQRNSQFYAQLEFVHPESGEKSVRRVKLVDPATGVPVRTIPQAVGELARLRLQRSQNALPVIAQAPRFKEFGETYLAYIRSGASSNKAAKKPRTIEKEEYGVRLWSGHFGGVYLDKITKAHIKAMISKRLNSGSSARTVNLDVIMLRNVLNHALDLGLIRVLPTIGIRQLKVSKVERKLLDSDAVERFCKIACERNDQGAAVYKNGAELANFVRLLATSGAREKEALRLRWTDVRFEQRQLVIGPDGDTKNSTSRVVDFNPALETHLVGMKEKSRGASVWLFPSPRRGDKDVPCKTMRETLRLVRAQAGLDEIGFHDFRHHFISFAVMSGIDFMTIAKWVGHRDGGVLIGSVYGHLADSHRKLMASKLNFGPSTLADTRKAEKLPAPAS